MAKPWNALILAAGRGPDDPMAKAYGVANKCTIPIAGKPMLLRVAEALETSGVIGPIAVSIEDPGIVSALLGDWAVVQPDDNVTTVLEGIREAVIPLDNRPELKDIPKVLKQDMVIHLVENMDEVLSIALEKEPKETPPIVDKGYEKRIPESPVH